MIFNVPRKTAAVTIEKASGIVVDSLKVESERKETVSGVFIGEDVKQGVAGFSHNNMQISGLPGMSIIDDKRNQEATQ